MVKKIGGKSGFQMSFAWIFAIIAGAFILFLAIYAVTQIVDTGEDVSGIQAGEEIGVLLNPLETSFEASQVTLLSMPVDTRIHNRCTPLGNFGDQIIRVSQRTSGDWSETSLNATFENKYIFSEANVEGRDFLLFSKPFELPFKITDLVYLTSAQDDYCFIEAPEDIKEELEDLGQQNIFTEECPGNSINVCFDGGSVQTQCDVRVDYSGKEVVKSGESAFFETDSLMYAAIFSDFDIYECQVKRIVKRAGELSSLYERKKGFLENQGCASDVDLSSFRNSLNNFQDSEDLVNIAAVAEDIDSQNRVERCRLW